MLRDKDIKNISELKEAFVSTHKKPEFFTNIIDVLKLGKFHSVFSTVKKKGIPPLVLIKILIILPFIDQKSIYGFIHSYWDKHAGFGKDAYYRLKNNPKINWRIFLIDVAKQVLTTLIRHGYSESKGLTKAFVFDDTTIAKTGYAIEGVSRVWDHVIHKSILGYKLLVMGLYDGAMFIPINFSLHREKGKNKKYKFGLSPKHYRKQYKKKRDKDSEGAKRKRELDISKTVSVVRMIKHAVKKGITANYVLTDSWFTCWEIVSVTVRNGMKFIGMFSIAKTLFIFRNKTLTYKEIRRLNKKHIKRSRRFNLYYIRTVAQWNGQTVALYFVRQGKRGKWKTIISTDLKLDFNKTIEIYQIRWSIEVFFKESKQMLSLGQSQSNDFDAQIADTTLVMVRYIFLALRNRIDKYESLGEMFKNTKADIIELRLQERLIALLIAILKVVVAFFEDVDEEKLIKKIIYDEQAFEKINRLIYQSETNLQNAA